MGLVCALGGLVTASDAFCAPASNILKKKLASPSPIQWRVGDIEVSLVDVTWGPADVAGMVSKEAEDIHVREPEFYPDRSYVLALGLLAKLPNVASTQGASQSGLVLIKNVDGEIQSPMELTTSGFVPFSGSPGVFDIRFNRTATTEYQVFFPVSPVQKEFLFEVLSTSASMLSTGIAKLSFQIIRKDDDFVIVNASSDSTIKCLDFKTPFVGTIGRSSGVRLRLTREGSTLSGTEQYLRIGKTLSLHGSVDSQGNVAFEERYPEDRVTGIFKGKISEDCRAITGLFSKPDGSGLQPFDVRENRATPLPDANESAAEPR
jgi:hypothetical protein